jgi:thioredoxin-dependent peroxiredoxin
LFGAFHHGRHGGIEAGRLRARFHRASCAGRFRVKFSLAEALKKGPVVLYFYPKSFTAICTIEAHEFAENIENFKAAGATVIGISSDKIEVQREFSTKECRDKFPVGADPSISVIKAYDAAFNIPLSGLAFADRISYVISPEGKILYSYADSNAEKHIKNTLAVVRKWREEHKPWGDPTDSRPPVPAAWLALIDVMAVAIAVAHIEAAGTLIVAVTCEAGWSNHDFITELLRVKFVGAKLATKGNGSICIAAVTLPACRRRPFSSMNPTTTFNQKRN